MTPIRAITLDLDDTLWPVAPAIQRAEAALQAWLREHAPAVGAQQTPETMRAIRDEVFAAADVRERTDMSLIRHRAIALALERSGDDPAKALTAYEVFNAARQQVEFYADSLAALERLAARFPLVAISNGTAEVERVGIGRHFRFALSARNVGVGKPDARIFHAACERLGVAPAEVLHVGDDPQLDVIGANRAGLRSAWVNRHGLDWPHDERAHYEFDDMAQLADWVLAR